MIYYDCDDYDNSYQISIDSFKYLLDPIGVVSALRTAVDGVGVRAVTERAEREQVDMVRSVEIFKISTVTIKTIRRGGGVRGAFVIGAIWGYWDHAKCWDTLTRGDVDVGVQGLGLEGLGGEEKEWGGRTTWPW